MPENQSSKKVRTRKFLLIMVIVIFILGLVSVWYSHYMGSRTKKGILTLHGWIEGDDVTVSPKVTGEVIKLSVIEGDNVKKGDLIARIDSEQIQARLNAATAGVNNAQHALKKTIDDVSILESRVTGAEIALNLVKKQSAAKIKDAAAGIASARERLNQTGYNYEKAHKDYIRFSALIKRKKISQSKMDSIEEKFKVSKAEVERTKKGLEMSEAKLALAKTTITEISLRDNELEILEKQLTRTRTEVGISKAVLASAKAKKEENSATLDDTYIYSPIKGVVVEKFVEMGEHVVPGAPIVLLIDMAGLYVKTYVEEEYIGKVKYKDPARIYVDSFPDRHFEGRVTLIAPRAEFTPRDVQMDEHRSKIVYKVKIGINNPEGILKTGMPADVYLKWDKDQPWD